MVAVALCCVGCAATPGPPSRAAGATDTAAGQGTTPGATSGADERPRRGCVGAMPAAWAAALHDVALPAGVTVTVAAQAGDAVFGQAVSPAGNAVSELDLRTGKLTSLSANAAKAGGLGALAADPSWLVWEQLDSQTNLSDWSVHARDRTTGENSVLATSRLGDGTFLAGQQPIPVIRHGVAAWAQPKRRTSAFVEAELRAVDLPTGAVSTLASGRISSPVYAGPYLVWATVGGDGGYALQAVDAGTLRPVPTPEALRSPGPIGYLAGSDDYLAWSNADHSALRVWKIGSPRWYDIAAPDPNHHFQFLQLAGRFVLWYSGAMSSVLDLESGNAFDVQGTVTGSADRIVLATASAVASVATRDAPAIGACG